MGDHVKQAGSYVSDARLRFDFTHFEALTSQQIKKVEMLANNQIMRAFDVVTYNTSLKEARESGVTALFGEKYGEEVRVVNIGEFSKELCGGCHVKNSSEIGFVKITGESSVGANARRIEACTSYEAYNYCVGLIDILDEVSHTLKSPISQVVQNTKKTVEKMKTYKKDLDIALSQSSANIRKEIFDGAATAKDGYNLLVVNAGDIGNYDIKEY